MIGSATSNAPPVPRFWQAGKIRCSASSRFVDVAPSRTPGLGLTVSRIWNSKVNSRSAGRGIRSVRTRIEHDPQRDGEALDIDALVPGNLQRNALQDRDHDAGG